MIRAIGTAARRELERELGAQVHLDLRVECARCAPTTRCLITGIEDARGTAADTVHSARDRDDAALPRPGDGAPDPGVRAAGRRPRAPAWDEPVENVGAGPPELRGRRTGARRMAVTQVIRRRRARAVVDPGPPELQGDPGQGRYWKLHDAASLEVWTLAPGGTLGRQRRGPKLDYCPRPHPPDPPSARRAAGRVYPGCNQEAGPGASRSARRWVDDRYPSTYYEQYVDDRLRPVRVRERRSERSASRPTRPTTPRVGVTLR
jgi:hypothetical protein